MININRTAKNCRIVLAPMQGWADDVMRDLLTRIGGFDEVVSEFVRITHSVHSKPIWYKYASELNNNAQTYSGTPCVVQLLGSDAENIALNAVEAIKYGAKTIDLNFGCPAPTVNKHQGGAVLLQYPDKIAHIVATVRQYLPSEIALTAKMRLGYENTDLALDCARAIADAGASILTVHARTKIQTYKPPALWEWFAKIQQCIAIPVYANGDIFTLDDFINLHQYFEPEGIMLGRGALMRPDLARQIKSYLNNQTIDEMSWSDVLSEISLFFDLCEHKNPQKYPISRLKQWLGLLKLAYPQAKQLFDEIRKITVNEEIKQIIDKTIIK